MPDAQEEVCGGPPSSGPEPRLSGALPALVAAGRAFVLVALFLVTLDAGVGALGAWPGSSFPKWFGGRVNEKVYHAVIAKGERIYGKDGWFEKTSSDDSTLAFEMAIMLKLKVILLAGLLAGAVAGCIAAIRGRGPRAGASGESPPGVPASPASVPMSILVPALAVAMLPFGAAAGFIGYLVADWQRRSSRPLPRGRPQLLIGYQLLCALVIVGWDVAAQIPWDRGWTSMYPSLYRIIGGG